MPTMGHPIRNASLHTVSTIRLPTLRFAEQAGDHILLHRLCRSVLRGAPSRTTGRFDGQAITFLKGREEFGRQLS